MANESPPMPAPEITSDSESECDTQEPLPLLPMLIGADSTGTSHSIISLADLTSNMAELTLDTSVSKGDNQTSDKVSPAYDYLKRSVWYLDSVCSRHMTRVKQNLHRYSKESGPKVVFEDESSACEKRKHHRASFKTKRSVSISKCLHLLHMDLFGPVKPQTISHNKYTLVIVDEYSRYTCVFCLKKKSDAADCIMSFIKKIENLNEVKVKELRSDNKIEFKNHNLKEFCDEKGIS
ncbi:retrovirus-related pol polyprotein from transposon TNT 1-94 [Tanacetum coccineum]